MAVSDMAACRAEALSKVYGRRDTEVHALRNITLSIPPHAFTAIMGPSGSGKSTLLHCLAALDTPTSGRVFLGQTELTSLSRRQQAQVRRDRIGFVFQAFNLVPTLNAIENITLPQLLAGRRPDREWLEYVVAQIGLADRMHHRPSQLSGGQQQRVALARALAGRPEVIFADEPTGNLDTKASREMLALLRSAVDDFRQTVVTVTHDPAIAGYADLVLFFTDGRVVDQVVHPEPDLVLEHLQYLDSSTPAHVGPRGQLHVSTQSDGQQIMRSRRRRQDQTGPGRPMVGSDDDVEVARQERWLQRIREQFEAEHEAAAGGRHDDAQPAAHAESFGNFPALESDGAGRAPGGDTAFLSDHEGTGNGFRPDARYSTGNGVHAATSYDTDSRYRTNGHVNASYDTGNGYATGDGGDPFGHSAPVPNGTYQNGHTDTRAMDADDGWLPPERSWLSDTGAAADAGHHASTHHIAAQGTWSQPDPAQSAPPAHSEPARTGGWHTNDWEIPEQTQRWDPGEHAGSGPREVWASADTYRDPDVWAAADRGAAGHEAPSHMTDTSHWSEASQTEQDDPWSSQPAAAEDGWSSITPQASSAERWDAGTASQQNGWHAHDSTPPASTNGHGEDSGWQRWGADQQASAASANGNGYHNDAHARPAQLGQYADVYQQRDERPAAPEEPAATASSRWRQGEPDQDSYDSGAYEQPVGDWYPAEEGSGWTSHDEAVEETPGPASFDIWAPASAEDDPWYQMPPTETEHSIELHQPAFTSEPATGDDAIPLVEEPRDLPAESVPRSRPPTHTATDPFEALQSLQSQLNRLGTGRRPSRRHGG